MATSLQRLACRVTPSLIGALLSPLLLTALAAAQSSMSSRALRPEYTPAWADVPPLRTIALDRDPSLGDVANGARLGAALHALVPGDRLVVGAGTWSVDALLVIRLAGTPSAPIRIEAAPGATPVLTRPDPWQNVINFGDPSQPARYVLLRGFALTGGSIGVRIYRADDLWLDSLHIHATGGDGIRASSYDCARLHVTRTEIERTALVDGTGEGFYLGSNGGVTAVRDSVVALNHVHHTGGLQGDGIELKQGSSGNLVAENVVHDTDYPGIIVYGTAGGARNRVEGNVVWGTNQNPFQVQGEALVRNNLVFGGAQPALISFDTQGSVRDLEVVHNTFISTSADAAVLGNWGGRPGMVLANNVLYSESGDSLVFLHGSGGIDIRGNAVHGPTYQDGGATHVAGNGISDFEALTWTGSLRDAHPSASSALLGGAVTAHHIAIDATWAGRTSERAIGAFERGTYGRYLGQPVVGVTAAPRLRSSDLPILGGPPVLVMLNGGVPGNFGVVGVEWRDGLGSPLPGVPTTTRHVVVFDPAGSATVRVAPPAAGAPHGVVGRLLGVARDATAAGGIATARSIEWTP